MPEMLDELLEYIVLNSTLIESEIRVGYLEPETQNLYGFFLNGAPVLRYHFNKSKVYEASLTITVRGDKNDKNTREFARLILDILDSLTCIELPTYWLIDSNSVSDLQTIGIDANRNRLYTMTFAIKYNKK